MGFDLSDYVQVDERIQRFRDKHPEGSLQSEVLLWPSESLPFVVVKASAYRTEQDSKPGIGHAWEIFPGKTPYTKGSELQNAETSAWGRAIVAALAADTKRGIASAEDVRNRASEHNPDEDWGSPSPSQDIAHSPPAVSTGAEDSSEPSRDSAPVAADLWDRIDQAVKAHLIRQDLVEVKAKRIAMSAEWPLPQSYGEIGKLRPDLLKALADDLKLDERLPA